jgi:hypothetical protein
MRVYFGAAEIWDEPDTAAIIAEVDRFATAAMYSGDNEVFLAQLQPAIEFWAGTQLEWARAGQITWAEWTQIGTALGAACAQIAAIDANFSYTDTFARTLKDSVVRDAKAVVAAVANAAKLGATWGLGAIVAAVILGAVAYGYAKGK